MATASEADTPARRLVDLAPALEASEETLLTLRRNLLNGLNLVARSGADGTYHTPGKKGEAPPRESGQLTLSLLVGVDKSLVALGHRSVFRRGGKR